MGLSPPDAGTENLDRRGIQSPGQLAKIFSETLIHLLTFRSRIWYSSIMQPFNSMVEARDFFWLAFTQSGGRTTGAKSCLVRLKAGVRQVTMFPGGTFYGAWVN